MTDPPPAEILTTRALERRVKRWLLSAPFDCFVQVAPGLEHVLLEELTALGLASPDGDARVERGGVALRLDVDGIMAANLALRTASRVLLRLGSFPASSAAMLHDQARRLPWEVHIGFAPGYALRMSSRRSRLQAGAELAGAITGAVARRMGSFGLKPQPDPESPLEVHVRLDHDRCTLSLNTSGEHLHRRGIRTHVGAAPARETLAAGVALLGLSSAPAPDVVVDPFCGSGALLIEAADLLTGLQPGRARTFAFEHVGWFRPGRWRDVRRRLAADEPPRTVGTRFLGIDSDVAVAAAARANLAVAGHAGVPVHVGDSLDFDFGALGAASGVILSNLPYGVRLGDTKQADALTRRFLSRLGEGSTRWRFALLVNDPERVTGHPDTTVDGLLRTKSGGREVAVVTGSVGGSVSR